MKLILELLMKSMEVDQSISGELRSEVKCIFENAAVCILWSYHLHYVRGKKEKKEKNTDFLEIHLYSTEHFIFSFFLRGGTIIQSIILIL